MAAKITTEQAVWRRAERNLDRELYDLHRPAARAAWSRDQKWFCEHPTEIVRIRRIRQGECQVVDDAIAADACFDGWAIILHHVRLENRKSSHGVGMYLVAAEGAFGGRKEALRAEARRLILSLATCNQAEDDDDDECDDWVVLDEEVASPWDGGDI